MFGNKQDVIDFLFRCINEKPAMLEQLSKCMTTCQTIIKGTQTVKDSVDACNEATLRKLLKTTMKSVGSLAEMNYMILIVVMMYIGDSSFTSTAAKMAMVAGEGDKAMKELLRQKMEGM